MIKTLCGGTRKYRTVFRGRGGQGRNGIVEKWKKVDRNTRRCNIRRRGRWYPQSQTKHVNDKNELFAGEEASVGRVELLEKCVRSYVQQKSRSKSEKKGLQEGRDMANASVAVN